MSIRHRVTRRRRRGPLIRAAGVAVAAALLVAGTAATALAAAPSPINLDSSSCPANIVEGAAGGCVTELQDLLNVHNAGIAVDGQFGPQTYAAVRQLQSEAGIGVDGQVGPQTKAALYGTSGRVATPVSLYSSSCPSNIVEGATGGCVVELQNLLDENGQHLIVDGQFGPSTVAAVEAFQTAAKIGVDGQVGPQTKHALYSQVSGSGGYTGAPTAILLNSPQCPGVMAEGEIDGCVTELQSELNILGNRLVLDGQFGPATRSAVFSFQLSAHRTQTGTVALGDKNSLAYAIGQVLGNLVGGIPQMELEYGVMSHALELYDRNPPIPYSWGGGHLSTPGPSLGQCDPSSGGGMLNGVCYGKTTVGLDCSGFTRYAYYLAGLDLNKQVDLGSTQGGYWDSATSGQMLSSYARPISALDARPGDLIFFGKDANAWDSDHVAIYAGIVNGQSMVYAEPTTGRNLSYEPLQPLIDSFAWTGYYHMAVFS
jgi:peptidoglycan hydrolase-like protein with peptidoglycan-binding domain